MSENSEEEVMSDAASDEDFDDTSDLDLESEFGESDNYLEDKELKPQKKAFEIDFKILSELQIRNSQTEQIQHVSNILEIPQEQCAVLLRFFKWNKERLVERFMDHRDNILDEAGLGESGNIVPRFKTISGFLCDICFDDSKGLQSFAMRCGHAYCEDCYKHYLHQKISEEGESGRIQCPSERCNIVVDSKTINYLVTTDDQQRYEVLLNRSYVDDKENLRWCPAPSCEFAVDCSVRQKQLLTVVPTVTCNCGHSFCFGCALADHQPCPCVLVKKWLKKCEDDSETANWISANTKECPKCISTIEKNGGCNHMTCRKCKHEFCWVCMGPWNEHGTSWYNCNRFEEKSGVDARDTQAKSRASLERYLHYYNRYANHEQSAKLDKDLWTKTEKKMTHLQASSGMSWIEVQYLDQASHVLQQCRQTLKWTYAFAFYLERNNLTHIFEDNQRDLEMAVEQLSELFEKPTDQLANLKVEMMDKTAYVNNRRVILLDDTAKGLIDGEWKFNISLNP